MSSDINFFRRAWGRVAAMLFALAICSAAWGAGGMNPAFYYGPAPLPAELAVFDTWVVEPDHFSDPAFIARHRDKLFAYVSLGEVSPERAYFGKIQKTWLPAVNRAWESHVVDQTASGWPAFFIEQVVAPLHRAGYRNFFLDTLDSYHLIAKTPEARVRQENAMVETLRRLKQRFPEVRLIFNRGFEILPRVHDLAHAVVAESLYQSWDARRQRYVPVPDKDRTWLRGQLDQVRERWQLPVVVIDYAPAEAREQAREIAGRIRAHGYIPWVTTGDLSGPGIGRLEPKPRKVLMLYDESPEGDPLRFGMLHRYAAMPINYLGYVPEYRNLRTEGVPEGDLAGRYAGIVTWFTTSQTSRAPALADWLTRQVSEGVPVAAMGYFGFDLAGAPAQALGLDYTPRSTTRRIEVLKLGQKAGYETAPLPSPENFFPLSAEPGADVWLRVGDSLGSQDAVAITSWGGYALAPFTVVQLPQSTASRWVIDPIEFFRRALKLPDMPVPDVTTENGRRLLITHVDGDGFANRAEFPGSPYASDVMYREILQRYRIPSTVSVIQAEVMRDTFDKRSPRKLEAIARDIFALLHVEAASHSYSHPFKWQALVSEGEGEGYNLEIPGYVYDEEKEIDGSVSYVNGLLPPGKRCEIFLWTGDCNPGYEPLARTDHIGIMNMNGGETLITRSNPTLSQVAPLGIPRRELFQVYAPNQNENLYTNLWTGPFYGYERVIETFTLTEKPRRIKPVDIYYHTYSASKPASLKALRKVYDWALAQPVLPVYVSAYTRKVLDFNAIAIAREGDAWRIAGGTETRTLRIPARMGYPDLDRSQGVLGWWDEGDIRYLHLDGSARSRLVLAEKPARRPWLARANARITTEKGGWRLDGTQGLELEFGQAGNCRFSVDGKPAKVLPSGAGLVRVTHPAHAGRLEMRCGD